MLTKSLLEKVLNGRPRREGGEVVGNISAGKETKWGVSWWVVSRRYCDCARPEVYWIGVGYI